MKKLPHLKYEKNLWKKGYKFIAGIDEVGRGCFAGPVVAGAVVFGEKFQIPIESNSTLVSNVKRGGRQIPAQGRNDVLTKVIINDSKKLSAKQREIADRWIKENCLSWGIGEASASVINRVGIVKATEIAFRKAIGVANDKLQMINEGRRKTIPYGVLARNEAISRDYEIATRTAYARNDSNRTIDFLLIDAFYIPYVKGLRRKNQKAIVKGDAMSISIAASSIIAKVYRDHVMEKIGARQQYKKYDWINNKGYGTKKHLDAIKKHGTNGYHRRQFVNTYLRKGNYSEIPSLRSRMTK